SPDFPRLDPAISFPYTPVVAPGHENIKYPEWLNDLTLYHNRGNSLWVGESVTRGDFFGLDDLFTEHPRVVEGMIEIYKYWVDFGVDGFRIDTVKHVNFEFWEVFTTAIMEHARSIGRDDFFMFGEVFDHDVRLLAPYVRDTDMQTVLDFAFQRAAIDFAGGGHARNLAGVFASDDFYITPTSSAAGLTTFLGNHDMGRVGLLLSGADDTPAAVRLAHELMFLSRGQPVIYYGDEQGFAGTGGDKEARQTMFPTQVEAWWTQPLITGEPMGSRYFFDTEAPLYRTIADLSALRAAHPALATGAQIQRYTEGHVYAFSRVDRDELIEYLVVLNSAPDAQVSQIASLTPGASFEVIWGNAEAVAAGVDGMVTVTTPGVSALVLRADRTVGTASSGEIEFRLPAEDAEVTGLTAISVTIDQSAWAETSFAWRIAGTEEWLPLGVAESLIPRVFHDVSDLEPGTRIEYRVVTVDASGNRARASRTVTVGGD
ncbi:MAG: alpha-amylase family glycosyl hydrolase, partial [Promicromonosporaceae bacterium]|nr:alpha-amylase family glycosyl hydrolase [Promicromonosporaceae bacterium]